MEFLFDTTNIADIERFGACFPYTGVTSNPSILRKDGQTEVFDTFRRIRSVVGMERSLHVQVVGAARDDMVKEAETILDRVDDEVYIKVPTTEEGLAAMQLLKQRGVRVTATAVYTRLQGFMAVAAGADYIAPYVNRVSDVDVDPRTLIASIAKMIEAHKAPTKIVAASFKNITQVNEALLAGAHAVTVQPRLLHGAFGAAAIGKAVNDFAADWHSIVGDTNFAAL
ncbi:MAG TPA: fructose-6-phosphate aldolase [Pseudonocardiaceae bacterium]